MKVSQNERKIRMSKIKVVVKEPLKNAVVAEIENTLEAKQALVGGYIEYIPFGETGSFDLYLNEEGKLEGLTSNLLFPADVIVGTIFVSKSDDEGEDIGLTENEATEMIQALNAVAINNEEEAAHYNAVIKRAFG